MVDDHHFREKLCLQLLLHDGYFRLQIFSSCDIDKLLILLLQNNGDVDQLARESRSVGS